MNERDAFLDVESLLHDLAAAAEAGGPEARAAAERLALALDPAVGLALMDALSQAAAEITGELPAGSGAFGALPRADRVAGDGRAANGHSSPPRARRRRWWYRTLDAASCQD